MLTDIGIVMWKEFKEILRYRGSRTRSILTLLVPLAVFAIMLPLQEGLRWFDGFLSLFASIYIPLVLVSTVVPESFAGERERHTLETLLASRLPDRAILFGKVAISIVYSWGMVLLSLLISFAVVNIANWSGTVVFYQPLVFVADVLLSFLLSTLATSLGVLISLRAAAVREAQQALAMVTLVPILILGVLVAVVLPLQLAWVEHLVASIESASAAQLLVGAVLILAALSLFFLFAAMRRFRRGRLVLS
jgi:ABC-2 type transport system permease protein